MSLMSDSRYKTITLYFDKRSTENMDLYDFICRKSQKNKKSRFIIGVLREVFLSSKKQNTSDEMCTEIAKKILEELKPQLMLVPVKADEEKNNKLVEKNSELVEDLELSLGNCDF